MERNRIDEKITKTCRCSVEKARADSGSLQSVVRRMGGTRICGHQPGKGRVACAGRQSGYLSTLAFKALVL